MTSNWFEYEEKGKDELQLNLQLNWIDFYPTPSLITDQFSSVLRVNSAFTELSGFTETTLPGKGISGFIHSVAQIPDESGCSPDQAYCLVKTISGKEISCHIAQKTIHNSIGETWKVIALNPVNHGVNKNTSNPSNPNIPGLKSPSNTLHPVARAAWSEAILATTPDLLVLFDQAGNVLQVNQNPSFPAPLLGRLIRNRNVSEILPGKATLILEKFKNAKESGKLISYYDEVEIRDKKRHLEYRLVAVEDNRTLAIIRDITDLKQTEEALYESQVRLNQTQRLSAIGSWDVIFEEKPTIHTWHFFELLGMEDPEKDTTTIDISHLRIVHVDDRENYRTLLDNVKNLKSTEYSTDYRIVDARRSTRHIHTESKLEYDTTGNLKRWSGTVQDITSQKKAENLKAVAFQISQLIHLQHNLGPLMQAIHQIIGTLMPAPNLLIALTSEDESQISFPYCIDPAWHPDPLEAKKGLIGFVLESGEPLLVSAAAIDLMISERIISKTDRIAESWLGVPLKTRDIVMGVLVLQSYTPDITYGEDEKNILIFVSEQIALSIQRIRADEALINAKNEAEESSMLKSSLLANMSHELRTPMTGILGFSEILLEELADDRHKVMASTIYKSANRLMSTLNSIMDLSAIEANIDSIKIKPSGIKAVFLPLLRNLHSIANDKGLYLRTALPPTLSAMADEKLLGQLLYHLLDNAIKFTIDGGVSVSAFVSDKNKSEVIIRIADTGIGIAPEHHKLIFEEFRQVSEGLSRTFEGSGLGLSLCVKMAKLINARLWVDSIPEKGSEFYVALPLALTDFIEEPSIQDTSENIHTHRLSRGPVPEVLIVEDNEINRRLAALYLRELCNTEMAENGYVALEKIKRKKYDAILMDINLGAGPNGISVANQVRLLENYSNTPIIAVTGYTMQGDKEKLLSNGCSHYLAKPYDKKTLLRLFSNILYSSSE